MHQGLESFDCLNGRNQCQSCRNAGTNDSANTNTRAGWGARGWKPYGFGQFAVHKNGTEIALAKTSREDDAKLHCFEPGHVIAEAEMGTAAELRRFERSGFAWE